MEKRRKEKPKSRYKCGQCALAQWLEDNRTLDGELFLLKCPHYKGGAVYHFASDTACDNYEPRERISTID